MIKTVKFLGDSFVWGQSLDWYDYGPNKDRFDINLNYAYFSQEFKDEYFESTYFKYPYNDCDSDSIYVKRYFSVVNRRWPAKVSKELNFNSFVRKFNGGSPFGVIHDLNDSLHADVVIILISDYRRDKCHRNLNDLPPYVKYFSAEDFARLVLIDLIGEFARVADITKNYKLHEYFYNQLGDVIPDNIFDVSKKFYMAYFKYLMEWSEGKDVDIYFVGSWMEDAELLVDCSEQEIEWYKDRLIPLYHNGIQYNSFYPFIQAGMTIDNEFDIDWEDAHPTQEVHDAVAESVIDFLRGKYDV